MEIKLALEVEEMKMFKNLTPHEIKIETTTGAVSIPASGTVARVETSSQDEAIFNGIRVVSNKADRVVGMPCPPEPCLVSGMVLDLLGSEDVFTTEPPGALL